MTFLMKRYNVDVQGYPTEQFDASTASKARAAAWQQYRSCHDVSFKDFLKISSIKRGTNPDGYGRPIVVSGKPAYLISRSNHEVRFALPDQDRILYSHPLDVSEVTYG